MPARRRPTVAPSSKEKKSADPKRASKPAAPKESGPVVTAEELALLGDRDGTGRASPVRIRRAVTEFLEGKATNDGVQGAYAHVAGASLVRFYRWHAEKQFGHARFAEFVRAELGLKKPTMFRYLKVVRVATREQAKWGIDTVIAVGRIIQRLAKSEALQKRFGLEKPPTVIDDLKDVRFTLPDGRVVDFGGRVTREDAEALVLALRPGRPAKRLAPEYARENSTLRETIGKSARLRGVVARHRLERGKRRFELTVPESVDLKQAMREILGALEKA